MRTFVINLPASGERRASMERQLESVGLGYEITEAVDGRRLTDAQRAELVDAEAVRQHPVWLSPGVIGCALSHLSVYDRVLSGPRDSGVSLVLEDDAVLTPGIKPLVEELAGQMYGSEVVLLYFRSFQPCQLSTVDAVTLSTGQKLAYPVNPRQPIMAAAYLITREACERMTQRARPVRAAADSWGMFVSDGAIDALRCLTPFAATVSKDFGSTIVYRPNRGAKGRLAEFVATQRGFPFPALRRLNRYVMDRRMTRWNEVSERSAMAASRPRREA